MNGLQSWREYGVAILAVAASSAVCFAIYPHLELTNLVMVYLLGTLLVSTRGHRGPAAVAAALSVLTFDFCFVPPRFAFTVVDIQYVWTFVVMFGVAMIISHLVIRIREEAEAVRVGEERSTWLMEKAKKAEIEAESERMRSSLLSSVSHDLRTPLTTIVGSAGALLENKMIADDPESRELLENIQVESERLSHLVQNLLEATRLETGTIKLDKQKYPLEEVVGSALERVGKFLKTRKVKVSLPESLPLVGMDATLIEQVLINLLENASRHTPPETPVEVSARQETEAMLVTVADRGPGLKSEELEKVFDKFYHAPSSPGSGLGLAICRAIVLAHGGRIWAENRPGGGAQFSFTLPLSMSSPTVAGGGSMDPLPKSAGDDE